MSKQFAVLGLGSFGWSVALTLEKMGADVLVVDDSAEKIQEISEEVSYALKADVSDPEALEAKSGRRSGGCIRELRGEHHGDHALQRYGNPYGSGEGEG